MPRHKKRPVRHLQDLPQENKDKGLRQQQTHVVSISSSPERLKKRRRSKNRGNIRFQRLSQPMAEDGQVAELVSFYGSTSLKPASWSKVTLWSSVDSLTQRCLYLTEDDQMAPIMPYNKLTCDDDLFEELMQDHSELLSELATHRIISLCVKEPDPVTNGVICSIILTERTLCKRFRLRICNMFCRLLELIGIDVSLYKYSNLLKKGADTPNLNYKLLYNVVKESTKSYRTGLEPTVKGEVRSKLVTPLRPYQWRAVQWAVDREKRNVRGFAALSRNYVELPFDTQDGKHFCINLVTGTLSSSLTEREVGSSSINMDTSSLSLYNDVQGGILADEMGIGKTLEVLGLVLANPSPPDLRQGRIIASQEEDSSGSDDLSCICDNTNSKGRFVGEMTSMNDISPTVRCRNCKGVVHTACMGGDKLFELGGYQCLHCLAKMEEHIACGSTLIVCPTSILGQWEAELARHACTGSLKVLVYRGVRHVSKFLRSSTKAKMDNEQAACLHPLHLSKFDVVLTTYATLREEVHHVHEVRRLSKFKKRFRPIPSPLVSLKWWRLALDEAQMVESSSAKAALMAANIGAYNRWCITGTPFSRGSGLDDLYGLVVFLGLRPWCYEKYSVWRNLVKIPFENNSKRAIAYVTNLLSKLMWRHEKTDQEVSSCIAVPPQTEHIRYLKLTPIESHFYKTQANETCVRMKSVAEKLVKESGLDKKFIVLKGKTLDSAVAPLLRLRQACCHPQIGRFGVATLNPQAPMTLEEIRKSLVLTQSLKCTEHLRTVLMGENGLAGLLILEGSLDLAAQQYRRVLSIVEKHRGSFKVDEYQELHALHNLSELYNGCVLAHQKVQEEEAHVKKIQNRIQEIRSRVVQRFRNDVEVCRLKLLEKIDRIQAISINQADSNGQSENSRKDLWCFRALQVVCESSSAAKVQSDLFSTVRAMAQSSAVYGDTVASLTWQFSSMDGLRSIFMRKIQDLNSARNDALKTLLSRCSEPTSAQVHEKANCGVCSRDFGKTGPTCQHCKAEDVIHRYRDMLYVYRESNRQRKSAAGGNYRDESVLLRLLRDLQRRMGQLDRDELYAEGRSQVTEALDLMKAECELVQRLWNAQRELLSIMDTLLQCTNRIQIADTTQVVMAEEADYILESDHVIPQKRLEMRNFVVDGSQQLTQAQSTLKFLKSLTATGDNHGGIIAERDANSGHRSGEIASSLSSASSLESSCTTSISSECPVCLQKKDSSLCIFGCGHHVCYDCVTRMIDHSHAKHDDQTIRCPSCRQRFPIGSIRTVAARNKQVGGDLGFKTASKVKGSWGTKIDAIVSHILNICAQDSESKILVFSQWDEVLSIILKALETNQIRVIRIQGNQQITRRLTSFKTDVNVRVLLLPVKSAGNGLNLTEATHVVMVEPMINTGLESQAISRVHRIGQTKKTYVWRYLCENTIEQAIGKMKQKNNGTGDCNGMELASAKNEKVVDLTEMEGSQALSLWDLEQLVL